MLLDRALGDSLLYMVCLLGHMLEPATSRTARTLFAPNYSATVDPEIFSCTTTRYLLGRHVKISAMALCVYYICRNLTALGVRNALRSVESSIQVQFSRNFFKCRPAKYTMLPVQHTRTQKKRFPCLIFGARTSDLPSKYGKASSIAGEFGDAR